MKTIVVTCFLLIMTTSASAQIPKFIFPNSGPKSGLELERRTQSGSFFDVVGRKAFVVGYENRALEAWVYPMKIADDFKLAFKLEGYLLEFNGEDIQVRINVRPEATTFTYSHTAFTVKQTIFAPIDEPGIVMLLDVNTVLPLQIIASFRPKLSLMWPAGLMTNYVDYNKTESVYYFGEETGKFIGIVGSPLLKDLSQMPYQEEPKDAPTKFVIDVPAETLKTHFIPIVIAGSVNGRAAAKATYDKLLSQTKSLYEATVAHYRKLNEETLSVITPDERLNKAFAWAKVGVDKGIATNPHLGTGLIAGFRTSGNSERPGFAWFFGRDALWTSLAINAYGDFAATKTALEFLKKFQREDGKIPHEISQSAGVINWFKDYGYAWHAADATPLFIIAHNDYLQASGDKELIKQHWDAIVKAYRFSLTTDTDGNGLIENTKFGHGWVEGGRLYPPHEEIYQQGVWVAALQSLARMAEAVMSDAALAAEARWQAERTREAIEKTYWIEDRKFYAYATNQPRNQPSDDERNEKNPAVKTRMKQLREGKLYDEVTVLPAVPMWWRVLDETRANAMLDRIGASEIATDWGTRILSDKSAIYDPLSYHYGSVWPLFTGWAAMAAYKYQRAHIGYDLLMANALLTYDNALGAVTELLSGDFNQAFGRSSHHQIWSCAMVVTPTVRGMLGLEVDALKNQITFAPQLPAEWKEIEAKNVKVNQTTWAMKLEKIFTPQANKMVITATRPVMQETEPYLTNFVFQPSFPLDAEVKKVTIKGADHAWEKVLRPRDKTSFASNAQNLRYEISAQAHEKLTVEIEYVSGTEVFTERPATLIGESSQSLKLLSAIPNERELNIVVEGLSERRYELRVRSHKRLAPEATKAEFIAEDGGALLKIKMPRTANGGYARQEIKVKFAPSRKR